MPSFKDPKRLSLMAAIMGSFVVGLDATVVNVALPSISADLGGGLAGQQWVSNAYLLALGSLILIGGSLGDVLGERRVFAIGVAGFGIVSMVCALAPSIEVLIAGRALQGVFGALLTPSALAVIVSTFPPDERGAAIGSWTAWSGIATVIGPLCGGYLIDATSWRWIFAINVPFVLITLMLVAVAVPKRGRETRDVPIDWTGAVLCALGLAGPVFALIRQPALGWGSPGVWVPALLGLSLFATFLWWESRTPYPMLPLELFRRRNFAVGNAQTFAMYGGLGITFFFLVLFLQQVAGYDALQAGLATLPSTIVMFTLSKRAGRWADRYGPRLFMGLGPLVAAAGLVLMQRIGARPDYWTDVFPALFVFSLGLSATVAPLTATVLADADEQNAGIASGVNNAVARVAALIAVAALGAVVSASFSSSIDGTLGDRPLSPQSQAAVESAKERTLATIDVSALPAAERAAVAQSVQDASVDAFHLGMGLSAILVACGGILGLVGIVNPRRRVRCEDCSGGQLVAAPLDAVRLPEREAPTAA
ncbi:Multidrug resistance protein Stp [Baekduia alba]|uniref:DHA2 family efflux MFS transporter permease subunit n=1 Tax=Baekduia alba TaxID=2997333 RepID=UPI002340D150|nr:DHA2 family efflux MFS transporter permease subunit [Baekduia alba]WCB96190.1 Multidrug resistance protein Stp [Baekduia alba]